MVSQTRTAKRTPAARHFGGGIHRSHGSKGPKPKGKSKHLILKWVLGIIGALLALGIGAFAYLYATTEIPQPESIAVAENTTVYYADGTTPIGTFSEQNREIIDCSVLPDYVGQAVVASEDRSFYTNRGIDLVGIARALAASPDILLADEPFSAVDAITRGSLQDEIKRIHRQTGITVLFVTHDIDEALDLGDKVLVMEAGRAVQFAEPCDILRNPATEFVDRLVTRKRTVYAR